MTAIFGSGFSFGAWQKPTAPDVIVTEARIVLPPLPPITSPQPNCQGQSQPLPFAEPKRCPSCSIDAGPATYVIHTPIGRYVGKAKNLHERWKSHLRQLAKGKHHSPRLQAAYDACGKASLWIERVSVNPEDEAKIGRSYKSGLLNQMSFDRDENALRMTKVFLARIPTSQLLAELDRRNDSG